MPLRTRHRARPATAVLAAATVVAGLLAGAVPSTAAPAADEPAPVAVDRFEGEVPFANQPAEGIFTWGGDADDPPTLTLKDRADAPEGAKVLEGTYDISGYGGLSHDYAADAQPHDWSAHKGIRFWWYGQNTAPLPPGSGKRINFEIKDGGANGEPPSCGPPPSPTTGRAGTSSRSRSPTSPTGATTSPSAASTRSSA